MIKSITSVKVTGRRVIVRAGFDVPLLEVGDWKSEIGKWAVVDDTRIREALATLRYLIDQRSRIILISHLDRPEVWDESKSLWPAAVKLGELIEYKVVKVTDQLPDYSVPHIYFLTPDITKKDYSTLSNKIKPGDILFLENLRFYKQEEANNEEFAKILSSFGDVYVNEAFSVAHRKEVSIVGLPRILPAYGGIALMKEMSSLKQILSAPKTPFVIMIGGAKINDKVETINNLAKSASHILVGGLAANSFLSALGYEIGKSKVSDVQVAKDLLRNYKDKIVLPDDLVVAKSAEDCPRVVLKDKVLSSDLIFDIGPQTIRKFSGLVKTAKTLVWNGPFGMIENPKFAFGSRSMAHAFAARSKGPAYGVVGGGETVEVVDQAKVSQFIDHISTGGGAMLEFLAGKKLPGIKALDRNS